MICGLSFKAVIVIIADINVAGTKHNQIGICLPARNKHHRGKITPQF